MNAQAVNTLWGAKKALPSRRNVIVSGMGILSPLGLSSAETFKQLCKGQCAIQSAGSVHYQKDFRSVKFPLSLLPDRLVGAHNNNLDATQREARHTKIAMKAFQEALCDAGLNFYLNRSKDMIFNIDKERIGVNVGIGIPCLHDIFETGKNIENGKVNKISPFFVPKILGNSISGQISVLYGLRGGSHCVTSACTTGAHCIGEAFRMIERGDCDVMIAGAAESCVHEIATTGFHRLRALSPTQSMPFDVARDGFVIGEGGAVMILEEATHAIDRFKRLRENLGSDEISTIPFAQRGQSHGGIPWYAEIIGYGVSSDGYHITAPHPEGLGCMLCMNRALGDAGVQMRDIDAVFAHATGTVRGDEIELEAITKARKLSSGIEAERKYCPVPTISFKGAIGHLLGAAGSVETALAILCSAAGVLPANVNLRDPVTHDRQFVKLPKEKIKLPTINHRNIVLKNSFGFGGTNASIVFSTKTLTQ